MTAMMEIANNVANMVSEKFNVEANANEIEKNNGVVRTGVTVNDGNSMCAPNIYIDDMIKDGMSTEQIADKVIEAYRKNNTLSVDSSNITDFSKAKENVIPRLVNKDRNTKLIETSPTVIFADDLLITFRVLVSRADDEIGTVIITNDLMKTWNVDLTADDLLALSKENAKRLMPPLHLTLIEMLGLPKELEYMAPPMDVLTNKDKINGATTIIYDGVLKEIADKLDADLIIIPSSINEVLIVPYSENITAEEYASMIGEVNASEVADADVLGTHPYIYRRETDEVTTY